MRAVTAPGLFPGSMKGEVGDSRRRIGAEGRTLALHLKGGAVRRRCCARARSRMIGGMDSESTMR